MTPAPLSESLVVRGPDSLPALVPHLVGFHPHHSLVLLGVGPRSTVRVTARADLPPCDADERVVLAAWAGAFEALMRADVTQVVLAIYPPADEDPWRDDTPQPLPRRMLVEAVQAYLSESGFHALDAVCVVGDRVRSYWCTDRVCCPAEGRVASPEESLRVRATFAGAGSAPLGSRADLVAALQERADSDSLVREVARARHHVRRSTPVAEVADVRRFLDGLREWADDPRDQPRLAALVARAEELCRPVRSRDLLLRELTLDSTLGVLHAARQVLAESVRCLRGPAVAPSAAVLSVCAWVAGDGAAARVAVERALDADPGYSLAGLICAALDQGVPPWSWVDVMAELSVEEILGVADRARVDEAGDDQDRRESA
jgi:hypothetical protein